MAKPTRRLGRGLASLVSTAPSTQKPLPSGLSLGQAQAGPQRAQLAMLPVDRIRQNPMQPRRRFDEASLETLAASIRAKGTLQPIVVRPAEGGYELVAGERRLRAARIAELDEIPAIIRIVADEELLELALIENIHREDLNPMERARAYQSLQDRYGLSHEEIAARVGEDRATVTNYTRLLGLAEEVIELVSSGGIGIGHAKVLLGLKDIQIQSSLARSVVKHGWSVRRLETVVTKQLRGAAVAKDRQDARPAVQDMEQKLSAVLETRVMIREGRRKHSGKVIIEYYSLDDFERIVQRLGVAEDAE